MKSNLRIVGLSALLLSAIATVPAMAQGAGMNGNGGAAADPSAANPAATDSDKSAAMDSGTGKMSKRHHHMRKGSAVDNQAEMETTRQLNQQQASMSPSGGGSAQ